MESRRSNRMQKNRMRRLRRMYRNIAMVIMTVLLIGGLASFAFTRDVKANTQTEGMKYYTSIQIGHGDSLWSIADAYKDDHYATSFAYVSEVAKINGIGVDDRLICGEYLIVPYYK